MPPIPHPIDMPKKRLFIHFVALYMFHNSKTTRLIYKTLSSMNIQRSLTTL